MKKVLAILLAIAMIAAMAACAQKAAPADIKETMFFECQFYATFVTDNFTHLLFT